MIMHGKSVGYAKIKDVANGTFYCIIFHWIRVIWSSHRCARTYDHKSFSSFVWVFACFPFPENFIDFFLSLLFFLDWLSRDMGTWNFQPKDKCTRAIRHQVRSRDFCERNRSFAMTQLRALFLLPNPFCVDFSCVELSRLKKSFLSFFGALITFSLFSQTLFSRNGWREREGREGEREREGREGKERERDRPRKAGRKTKIHREE